MQPLLECKNVSFAYHGIDGETQALSELSFSLKDGEFAAVVGPSGCGKSTLLSLLCRLEEPEYGEIYLHGKPLCEHTEFHIGYMPQRDQLFEWRSILKNVMLGPEIRRCADGEHLEFVEHLMREYGLWEFRNKRPGELSGGMRQRAALIRTLALQPELLLLDEPFSALDYQTRLNVSEDIYRIIKREHKTALLVTHDISEAVCMADKVLVLSARPARLVMEVPIRIEMKERTPMKTRNTPEFKDYFNRIWKELNPDVGKKEQEI
ncbi:MAG: ABC transporter ATP-binding protein [Eubacteriales bacterium]|nr:ABC transporter ATP-binding protein [Eubacteriales bacterium]